jgi:hypothetical protein
MNKFIIYYWKYKNDDWVDVEREVEAINFDEAYKEFKKNNPTYKIRCINQLI